MFNSILIPVDLGHIDRVDQMMASVKSISTRADAQLMLLTVLPEVPGYVVPHISTELLTGAVVEARTQLEALAKRHGLGGSLKIKVIHGNPSQAILSTALDEKADLIVIGSHKPGLADYLLGSVASKVVRHAVCSVVVVR
ncbi:MAG: universal stress protein [Burkholderiaceae bacterium]